MLLFIWLAALPADNSWREYPPKDSSSGFEDIKDGQRLPDRSYQNRFGAIAIHFSKLPSWKVIPDHETRVIDGDTLVVKEERIRLKYFDAPEKKQTCLRNYPAGQIASEALQKMVSFGLVCRKYGTDRYRRTLAECSLSLAKGRIRIDAATLLVMQGITFSYRNERQMEEQIARKLHIGVHRYGCLHPSDWRKSKKESPHAPHS